MSSDATRTVSAALPRRSQGAASAQIFVVLSGSDVTAPPLCLDLDDVGEVGLGRGNTRHVASLSAAGRNALSVTLLDPWMSTRHAVIAQDHEGWSIRDLGSKNGTWLDGARITHARLEHGAVIEVGASFLVFRDDGSASDPFKSVLIGFASVNPDVRREIATAARLAPSSVALLLLGDTGTGKEVLARELHRASLRSGAFVPVNCGALPATLVESLLFGHMRGAFSGADGDREGLIAASHGGTLFLDEIGDLPLAQQAALLRVLESSEVTPVGATRPRAVDLRVMAATHRDLYDMARKGTFREDLLARLAGHVLRLPTLRDRREDLGLLLASILPKPPPELTPRALRAIFLHPFPHNTRELKKLLQSALVLAQGGRIDEEHLHLEPLPAPPRSSMPALASNALSSDEQAQRDRLIDLLRTHQGNVSAVAREWGKERLQIRRWLKRYGLSATSFRRDG